MMKTTETGAAQTARGHSAQTAQTAQEPAAVLRTEALSAGYEGRAVLENIAFSVRPGEILTLVGPNGAGKSTLLKTIARLLTPVRGRVILCGEELEKTGEQELSRRLALILTERLRGEMMSCGEVVSTGRYPYTGRLGILSEEDREKVRGAMALSGVEHLSDRDFTRISDGQRQLVMLARAICQEPEVLVMDEPTSFLDIRHKTEFLTTLKKLAREKGIAVVMSLHELDLAKRISDRVVCVREGRADRMGPPEEVLTESYIETLYGMEPGSYRAFFGEAAAENAAPVKAETEPAEEAGPRTEVSPAEGEKRSSFFQHRQCEYFPCHKGIPAEEFNCLFCYCPLYALGDRCGGNFRRLANGVKDCSGCNFPHWRKNYRKVLERYPEIAALAAGTNKGDIV